MTFQPTRPLRGATVPPVNGRLNSHFISTHAPLAGRDRRHDFEHCTNRQISTHAPLAGRDLPNQPKLDTLRYFNPRAPCGARRLAVVTSKLIKWYFNPRAPCGARRIDGLPFARVEKFQPTRPLRGATAKVYKSLCTFLR